MPVLKQHVKEVKKVYLPSTKAAENEEDRAWVELNVGATSAVDLIHIGGNINTEGEFAATVLVNRIVNWNFTDKELIPLPVTLENVAQLETEDYVYLQKILNEVGEPAAKLSPEDEKNLSSTSTQ